MHSQTILDCVPAVTQIGPLPSGSLKDKSVNGHKIKGEDPADEPTTIRDQAPMKAWEQRRLPSLIRSRRRGPDARGADRVLQAKQIRAGSQLALQVARSIPISRTRAPGSLSQAPAEGQRQCE